MADNQTPLIEFIDVSKSYPLRPDRFFRRPKQVVVLSGVSFRLTSGSSLAIVGESGAGKSTLARLLLGLELPTSGEIRVGGTTMSLGGGRKQQLSSMRKWMQPVFQDPSESLNSRMKVGSIVEEPLTIHRPGESKGSRREAVERMLIRVGLRSEYVNRYPHQLSGGQRQRVAIARALILEPRVLVLDEPVSALDVSTSAQVLNLLPDLREQLDISYLFISHDFPAVRYLADEVVVMKTGIVVESGSVANVLTAPSSLYTRELIDASTLESLGRLRRKSAADESGLLR